MGTTAIDYAELTAQEGSEFAAMTFSSLRHLLSLKPCVVFPAERDSRPVRPFGVAARYKGQAAGLALGAAPIAEGGNPELHSVFVRPELRNQGIGTALVERFEEATQARGFERVETVYMTGKPGAEIFERILQRRGWSPPATRMIVVKFTVAEAMTTPWYKRYDKHSQFEFFPWVEIREAELEELKEANQVEPWIPSGLEPWLFDNENVEQSSSIGIRLDGKLVGWVLNHALSDTLVRFTCSYIRPDLAKRGHIVPAYSESIRRLSEGPYTRCTFTVPVELVDMVTFVRKWCEKWITYVGETRGAAKRLASQ